MQYAERDAHVPQKTSVDPTQLGKTWACDTQDASALPESALHAVLFIARTRTARWLAFHLVYAHHCERSRSYAVLYSDLVCRVFMVRNRQRADHSRRTLQQKYLAVAEAAHRPLPHRTP